MEAKSTHCGTAIFFIFTQPQDFTDPVEDLCIHVYLESSCIPALPTNIHAHTHLLNLLLSPGECGEYTGTKDTDACFCLALSHLRAAAARELAGAGAWAGHKATGTTGTPIWSSFGFRLWFCLPKICLPRQQIESGHFYPGIFWHLILFALPKA